MIRLMSFLQIIIVFSEQLTYKLLVNITYLVLIKLMSKVLFKCDHMTRKKNWRTNETGMMPPILS